MVLVMRLFDLMVVNVMMVMMRMTIMIMALASHMLQPFRNCELHIYYFGNACVCRMKTMKPTDIHDIQRTGGERPTWSETKQLEPTASSGK